MEMYPIYGVRSKATTLIDRYRKSSTENSQQCQHLVACVNPVGGHGDGAKKDGAFGVYSSADETVRPTLCPWNIPFFMECSVDTPQKVQLWFT